MLSDKVEMIEKDPLVHAHELYLELNANHRFPKSECCLCGSSDGVERTILRSITFGRSMALPLCLDCQICKGNLEVEYFLKMIKVNDSNHWDRIVSYNIRKLNWISKLTLDIMKE